MSHIVRGIERSDVGYVKRAFKKFLKMGFFESEMRNRDYYFSLKREYIKRVFELIEKNSCPYCSDYLKKKDFCNYCKKEISQE
ncbi:MAG: hypothetical protein JXA99_04450 [Candidatus Lokiarchaeota archaeon]|nr:hypothetical protein [Candidatus Lokiarchaeota archaeon]